MVGYYVPFVARAPLLMFSICCNFPLIHEEADVAFGVCTNVALSKRKLKFKEVWHSSLTERVDAAINFECDSFYLSYKVDTMFMEDLYRNCNHLHAMDP